MPSFSGLVVAERDDQFSFLSKSSHFLQKNAKKCDFFSIFPKKSVDNAPILWYTNTVERS